MDKVLKHRKKLLRIIILLVFLAGGFFSYYKYFAKGTLVIKSQTPGANISVNGEEYNNVDEVKIKLKPNQYNVIVSKEDYLESYYHGIEIKALKSTKLAVDIGKSKVIGKLEGQNITPTEIFNKNFSGDYHIAFDSDDNRLLLVNDKTIYSFPYNEDLEEMKKGRLSQLTEILFENEIIIMDIQWSNQVDKAILRVLENESEKVYIFDLDSQSLESLGKNITEACWMGNNKIGYISNDGQKQQLYLRSNKQGQKIKDLNTNTKNLFCANNKLAYYFNKNNNIYLNVYDIIDDQNREYLIEKQSLITPLYSQFSPDASKIVEVKMKNENNKKTTYLIDFNQDQPDQLDLEIYTKEWLFDSSNLYLIYLTYKEKAGRESMVFGFNKYNLATKENKEITTVTQSADLVPQDLVLTPNGKTLFFINGNNLAFQEVE